jgi:hypothetical protein
MLSGYALWWINLHPLSSELYTPGIFWAVARMENVSGPGPVILLALCVAAALLGGKYPVVLVALAGAGLYAAWSKKRRRKILGFFSGTVLGIGIASLQFLPALELYAEAGPLAHAIRTAAASHHFPAKSALSLLCPLLLGKNYMYDAWYSTGLTPPFLPPVGLMTIGLACLGLMTARQSQRRQAWFFFFVTAVLIAQVYGWEPVSRITQQLPLFSGVNFLKYNGLLYFSLATLAALGLQAVREQEKGGKVVLSFALAAGVCGALFLLLREEVGSLDPRWQRYLGEVGKIFFCGLGALAIVFLLRQLGYCSGKTVAGIFLVLGVAELLWYAPKERPQRLPPPEPPAYVQFLRTAFDESGPFRILGEEGLLMPLISGVYGLQDLRSINILIPKSSYLFFQRAVGATAAYTKEVDVLFAATSPGADLANVRYILTQRGLQADELPSAVRKHVIGLRWSRLFASLSAHRLEAEHVWLRSAEGRTAFLFTSPFSLDLDLVVSSPFFVFAVPLHKEPRDLQVTLRLDERTISLSPSFSTLEGPWRVFWFAVEAYQGREATVRLSVPSAQDVVTLALPGLSPGPEEEEELSRGLLKVHREEWSWLREVYRGEGIFIYENLNALPRAFLAPEVQKRVNGEELWSLLERQGNLRQVVFVVEEGATGGNPGRGEISWQRYGPQRVSLTVKTEIPSLLVLSDLFYPGWHARVDGKEVSIVAVDGALRGIWLTGGGEHRVEFFYRPRSFFVGGGISLLSLGITVFLQRRK